MAIVAVSIAPVGEGVSVSPWVARALEVLAGQDRVRYQVGPMFTTLEGDLDEILRLIRAMHEAMFEGGARRVSTVIKIDDRRDRAQTMEDKVAAVERRLAATQGEGAPGAGARPS
ncbi:MTH1187 family thiamine-binding protein [Thermaerobacter sp. PB12/4term]|uniref:MTH1187 family thiamine-binding protein n=1 Tax=Thermaerobacter sp. PB12/4term TaxID=2293838 RepID=UPI000E32A002|nr:MTH1187 family thiamine-binding protein [Thermaerobacter sp. PB12/4term]QIA26536.1 MTH1187 family thiamine-binding protein [Thermaerobacter sp. PB12/4term]